MSILPTPRPEGPEGVLCSTCGAHLISHWEEADPDGLWEGYWSHETCTACTENRKITEEYWELDQQLQRQLRQEKGLDY